MKKLTLLALLLATSAQATVYNWSMESSKRYFADSPDEITDLLVLFPEVLKDSDITAEELDFITLDEAIFKYTGDSICPANDPRLTHKSITFMACPTDRPTECITKFGPILTNRDPCKN